MNPAAPVLVTGASGYIGPFVLARLRDHGLAARTLSRTPFAGSLRDIVAGDFTDRAQIAPALQGARAVIHLAGRAHVFHEQDADPAAAYRHANTEVTLALGRAAKDAGVKRFVFMSTVKVYGECFAKALTETDPTVPEDDYGRTKLAAEEGLKAICADGTMTYTIIRSPMVYGPNGKGNVRRLAKLVKTGLPLPLGSVRNRRSIVAVDNLADILVRCAQDPNAANETFLVADGAPISTPQMVRGIAAGLGAPARLLPFPPRLLEMAGRLTGKGQEVCRLTGSLEFDISHLKAQLGWQPVISTEDALYQTGQSFAGDAS